MTEKYNGWTNYETWSVGLWLTNDEGALMTANEIVQYGEPISESEGYDMAKALKTWVEDQAPKLPGYNDECFPMGLFDQLIQAALSDVNWSEIVENLREP